MLTANKDEKILFSYLTEDYSKKAVDLLTLNFVFFNSIWKKLGVKKEEG